MGVRARGKRERIAQPRQLSFDINSPPKVHTGNILYKVYTRYNCHLSAPPIDTGVDKGGTLISFTYILT